MQKWPSLFHVLLVSFSILSMACNQETPPVDVVACELSQKQEDTGEEVERAPACVIPERAAEANLEINVAFRDFLPEQEAKMQDALERLLIVMNSTEFKERILNHEYQGEKVFVDNNGLSNEEIYQAIMEGAETLDPVIDEEIDIDITLYFANNSTVGYTYPNVDRIWVNNKFFSRNTLGKVAANVAHEWTHKLGFNHDFNRTTRRNFSVPYAVGSIVQELVDGL